MFFNLDRKIEALGFKKIKDDQYGIEYERNNGMYIHKVALLHKHSGENILQSYDPNRFSSSGIGNLCVGLTYKELTLFAKKMKQAW